MYYVVAQTNVEARATIRDHYGLTINYFNYNSILVMLDSGLSRNFYFIKSRGIPVTTSIASSFILIMMS